MLSKNISNNIQNNLNKKKTKNKNATNLDLLIQINTKYFSNYDATQFVKDVQYILFNA